MTLIGVAALGKPDLLVEVAGVVILDRARSGWLWW